MIPQLIHTNQAYVYSLIKVDLLPVLKLESYKVDLFFQILVNTKQI